MLMQDFDVAQQLSVYDDDEEDTDIDVKYSVENDFFNTNTDTESVIKYNTHLFKCIKN